MRDNFPGIPNIDIEHALISWKAFNIFDPLIQIDIRDTGVTIVLGGDLVTYFCKLSITDLNTPLFLSIFPVLFENIVNTDFGLVLIDGIMIEYYVAYYCPAEPMISAGALQDALSVEKLYIELLFHFPCIMAYSKASYIS